MNRALVGRHSEGESDTRLLAVDEGRSVLGCQIGQRRKLYGYTAYGRADSGFPRDTLLAFKGENIEPSTGLYLLGNGYRGYSPTIMRFYSPDSLSPFGKGGLNAYAYCGGDPINRSDPSGHAFGGLRKLVRRVLNSFDAPPPNYAAYKASFAPPPKYTPLPVKGQKTTSLNLGSRDTTSPITSIQYETQVQNADLATFYGEEKFHRVLKSKASINNGISISHIQKAEAIEMDRLALDMRWKHNFEFTPPPNVLRIRRRLVREKSIGIIGKPKSSNRLDSF